MSYYSRYMLRSFGAATIEDVRAAVRAHHEYRPAILDEDLVELPSGALLVGARWNGGDGTLKWYAWDEDMAAISQALPGNTLVLDIIGESWESWEFDRNAVLRQAFRDGAHVGACRGSSSDGLTATFPISWAGSVVSAGTSEPSATAYERDGVLCVDTGWAVVAPGVVIR